MKKKTLTILAALLAIAQGAWAQAVVNDEAALNYAIAGAEGETISIRLGADITLSAYLKIGESEEQAVVIDLCGHKLRRNLGAVDANGHVIKVFGKGELTLKDSGKGGEISGGRANNGGGICNYGTLHLEGGAITGCYAEVSGGGIYNAEGATLTITGGSISGNTASDHAGAVYSKGDLSIANCTVSNNKALDVGGIYNAAGGTAVITGCTLTGNTGTRGCGAIGNATASSSMAVSDCTITDNFAGTNGGGIWTGHAITVSDCTIKGNVAAENGGGIYNAEGATLTITGGSISGNTASDHAGAVYSKGDLSIANCTVSDNKALDVGGIYNAAGGTAVITGCTLTGNTGTGGCGAIGNATASSSMAVSGCTIAGNTSGTNGGGIWTGHAITVRDCTIKDNAAAENGGGVYVRDGTLSMQGAVKINGNENPDGRSNLYLTEGKVVNFTDPLSGDAVIGVYMEGSGVFTNGYRAHNTNVNHFFSDGGYDLAVNTDGEAYQYLSQRKYIECSWDEANKRVVHTVREIPAGQAVDNICTSKYANGGDLWGDYYWFIADGSASIDGYLTCQGKDVHLILCDGASVNLKGLFISQNTTLHIYCQSYGGRMGKLSSINDEDCSPGIGPNGSLIIHGGSIYAKGGDDAAGIGGCRLGSGIYVAIFDGKIEAYGGDNRITIPVSPDLTGGGAGIGGGAGGYKYTADDDPIITNGGTLFVYGGEVNAHGGGQSAGIGSADNNIVYNHSPHGGTVVIHGGSVKAWGGKYAAGIGGGQNSNGANVTITGGYVEAHGGSDAAGIGNGEWNGNIEGNLRNGGTITITGGRVEAYGGELGAGIGGGQIGSGGNISIAGGQVFAYGGNQGAGIGGGENGCGGTILIAGGQVFAYGGNDAAGIGSGQETITGGVHGGTITITGGYVYAEGNDVAAGIGAGEDADMGNITITGGIVEAYGGGGESWANAIASNDDNENVNSLTIGAGMKVTAGTRVAPVPQSSQMVPFTGLSIKDQAPRAYRFARIEPCDHPGGGYTITNGAQHRINSCGYCLKGGSSEVHAFDGDSKCACGLLGLRDNADNTPVLTRWNNTTQTVALRGNTFFQDTGWSTLCLPFDLAPENMAFGNDGVQLKTLEKATFNTRTGTLTLHFADAGFVEAGRPCLVYWNGQSLSPVIPLFTNVTLKSLAPQDESPGNVVKFRGTYAPVTLKAGEPALYLDDEDRLRLPDSDTTVGAFHAWLQTNTSSLGDVNSDDMITVVDVTMLVDHILGREDANFFVGNSDLNGDEMVSVADVTELVDIILHGGYDVKNVVVFGVVVLSTTSLRIAAGATGTVEVTSGSGSYEVESSDPGVATASIDGATITVTAIGEGEATITVTDTKSGQTAGIAVSVSMLPSYLTCPDDHHPHLIDLGLPSGTMWACCNVGADKPEAYGGYYAWGETEEKDTYTWDSYAYGRDDDDCDNLGSDIAGTQYDVAHVKWGGSWMMPSQGRMQELIDNCNSEWTTVGRVEGRKFTNATTGASIFLPAAGHRWDDYLFDASYHGYYWSSMQDPSRSSGAYGLDCTSGGAGWSNNNRRYYGIPVRPVSK